MWQPIETIKPQDINLKGFMEFTRVSQFNVFLCVDEDDSTAKQAAVLEDKEGNFIVIEPKDCYFLSDNFEPKMLSDSELTHWMPLPKAYMRGTLMW